MRKKYERGINRSSRLEVLPEKALPEIPQNQQENTRAGTSLSTESQAEPPSELREIPKTSPAPLTERLQWLLPN